MHLGLAWFPVTIHVFVFILRDWTPIVNKLSELKSK